MNVEYINGYKNPLIIITDLQNNQIAKYEFKLDKDGLTEEIILIKSRKTNIKNNIIYKRKGIFRKFTLSLKQKSNLQNTLNVINIVNYANITDSFENPLYKIFIVPRKDYEYNSFQVELLNDSITMKIQRGGIFSKGMKGIELVFETINIAKNYTVINPNDIQYSGYTMPILSLKLQT